MSNSHREKPTYAHSSGNDRVAVVTGARVEGISFSIAMKLLLAGWVVVMGDRDKKAGTAAVKRLRKSGFKKVWFNHADFSNELHVGKLMELIRRKFGKLNLLVNTSGSAGNPHDDNLAVLTSAGLRELFRDNVLTFYNMTRAAVTQFMQHQETGGVVIALSTNNGVLGIRGQLGYGAMKQSLVSFCRSLTVAYAKNGIRFVVVTPGVVLTNSDNWRNRLAVNPRWSDIEGSLNPTGRMLTPDDVANVVIDISGDHWQMVTGTEIVIDGGERAAGGDHFSTLDINDYRRTAVDLEQSLRNALASRDAA